MATPPTPPQPPPDLRPLDQVMAEFTDDYRAFLTGGAKFLQVAASPRHRRDVAKAQRLLAELEATRDTQIERLDQLRRWWAFLQDEAVVAMRAARGQDNLKALDDLIASKTDQQRLIAQQLELVNENGRFLARVHQLEHALHASDQGVTRLLVRVAAVLVVPATVVLVLRSIGW